MSHPSSVSPWNRGLVLLFWVLLAIVPVTHIVGRALLASRNIPFWDEFDTVLAFVLHLDAGLGIREFFQRIFEINSEHRTLTSRLLVAGLFGLTGKVNFHVIAAIGNLMLLGLCGLLVASAGDTSRRIRLAVLLAFGLFHLELYETFLWSGASIDHHTVLFLAGGAIFALARGGRPALGVAVLFALGATFTLAHGCLVWVIGGAMLAQARRWRALIGWVLLSVLALAVYFHGFEIVPSHRIRDYSVAGLGRLVRFWLELLGGPLTFGARGGLASILGLTLVSLLAWLGLRGTWRREPIVMPLAIFAVAALALMAFGRFEIASPHIQSRYLLVGSLAWSLAAFMVLERWSESPHPFRPLAWALPAIVGFNVASNLHGASDAATFLWSREYPALRFKQYNEEGHGGPFRLYPHPGTVKRVLTQASARRIYELPSFCHPRTVPEPQLNPDMVTYVVDLTADQQAVGFEGWAMFPKRESSPGQIHVLLRSEKSSHVFSTVSVDRSDVAKAFKEPLWRYCGYNFVLERDRLPAEDFQIGLLISDGERSELKMTDHWLRLESTRRSNSD